MREILEFVFWAFMVTVVAPTVVGLIYFIPVGIILLVNGVWNKLHGRPWSGG